MEKQKGEQPEQKKSKKLKSTVTFLDWTLLPISEGRQLKRSFVLLGLFVANIFVIFRGVLLYVVSLGKRSKDGGFKGFSTAFKEKNRHLYDRTYFLEQATDHDINIACSISKMDLLKRKVSVTLCSLLLLLGFYVFGVGFVNGFSFFRAILALITTGFFAWYCWKQISEYDNIIILRKQFMPNKLDYNRENN